MGSENFSDFLIPLKFTLDEPSKKKFDAAVGEVEKRFAAIGAAAGAAAVALGFAVREISKNLAQLAYAAERVGASSEELKALGTAADRVGIGAEAAKSSLSGFFAFVNFEGGASAIKQWFKIDFDPKHPLKAMLDSAVQLADTYATGTVAQRQTAIREAQRAGINETLLTTPGAARRLREEMQKDEAFTGGKLNPIAESAKRLNAEFEKVKQHLQDIGQLASGSLQDAFSDLLETVDGWLKAHRNDIIWFSNKSAEIADELLMPNLKKFLEEITPNKQQKDDFLAFTKKISDAWKIVGDTYRSFWDGSIANKINAALEWAFQPFKWLWDKLQSLGLVGPGGVGPGEAVGGRYGPGSGRGGETSLEGGEGTSSGGGRAARGRASGQRGAVGGGSRGDTVGGGSSGGGSLGKVGWWTPERQKHAYDRLVAGGLSDAGAKGLISRWVNVESTSGPTAQNAIGGGHYGIGQWSRTRAGSLWGNPDFDAQLDHVLKEIEGSEAAAGRLLKDAKTREEGARAASAYERAEHYSAATHWDDSTAKALRGAERVEKAIGGSGKEPATTPGQGVIPGQTDPHKPGFDPLSVPFHHSSRFPLGHQHFASNQHHDNRIHNSNIEIKVAGQFPVDKTARPLERSKNAALIRNTTSTAA